MVNKHVVIYKADLTWQVDRGSVMTGAVGWKKKKAPKSPQGMALLNGVLVGVGMSL